MMRRIALAVLVAVSLGTAAGAQTLRIGLQADPDALDPATSGSFTTRIVLAALCDKLIDVDADLNYVPQLATAWRWEDNARALVLSLRQGVVFHDGTPLDAEAVRVNLERYRSAPESLRKTELRPVSAVEVVDPATIRLRLSEPYAPILAVLSDRAGMMMSPRALASQGAPMAQNPVCSGPFRFVERVMQERIVADRFDRYWDAGAIHLDRVVYQTVVNSSVRLANLRAGALELIERVAPTDLAIVRAQPRLRLMDSPALGYITLSINVANGPRAAGPLGNPRIR